MDRPENDAPEEPAQPMMHVPVPLFQAVINYIETRPIKEAAVLYNALLTQAVNDAGLSPTDEQKQIAQRRAIEANGGAVCR